jgi:hypothetical protein
VSLSAEALSWILLEALVGFPEAWGWLECLLVPSAALARLQDGVRPQTAATAGEER